jgi:hypothetical protein
VLCASVGVGVGVGVGVATGRRENSPQPLCISFTSELNGLHRIFHLARKVSLVIVNTTSTEQREVPVTSPEFDSLRSNP